MRSSGGYGLRRDKLWTPKTIVRMITRGYGNLGFPSSLHHPLEDVCPGYYADGSSLICDNQPPNV